MKNNNFKLNKTRGFTLFELLIVTAILAVLAAMVFTSLSFEGRFRTLSDARNSKRRQDLSILVEAVRFSQIENQGRFPAGLDSNWRMIGTATTTCNVECGTGSDKVNLQNSCLDLSGVMKTQLRSIPWDPSSGSAQKSYYAIRRDSSGQIVEAKACAAEGTVIEVGR